MTDYRLDISGGVTKVIYVYELVNGEFMTCNISKTCGYGEQLIDEAVLKMDMVLNNGILINNTLYLTKVVLLTTDSNNGTHPVYVSKGERVYESDYLPNVVQTDMGVPVNKYELKEINDA